MLLDLTVPEVRKLIELLESNQSGLDAQLLQKLKMRLGLHESNYVSLYSEVDLDEIPF